MRHRLWQMRELYIFFNCEYMPIPDGDETSEPLLLQKMDPYGGDLLFKGR
jgi:hypothetical protein